MIKFTRSDIRDIKEDLYRETGILYLLNSESEDISDILIELETLFEYITNWEEIECFDNDEDYFEFIVLLQEHVYYGDNLNNCIAHKTLVDKILAVDVKLIKSMERLAKIFDTEDVKRCVEALERYQSMPFKLLTYNEMMYWNK